jgi:hypothetical protein
MNRFPQSSSKPPHPATVIQPKRFLTELNRRPPHRATLGPRGGQSIQRAAPAVVVGRVNIAALGGWGVMSAGQNYFIPDDYGGELIYATAAPRASVNYGKAPQVTYAAKTWDPYVSRSAAKTGKFVQDCLHTAEEIDAGKELAREGVHSKLVGTGEDFGNDEASNIARAKARAQDDAAVPSVGNAYVIVNTVWPRGAASPYHAAAVVAVDGNDRVTIEVFASATDGRRTVQNAKYRMYSVGAGGLPKFHKYWVDNYFGANAATIVIEPK